MEQLINFIIRPPRAEYDPNNDLLDQEFLLKGRWYQRKDLEVKNSRGDVLQCSHYMPVVPPEGKTLPCVIYCHGNSGCRTDASEAAVILLPSNITVFTLDFSGSGLSGGEHVTLGWNEKDDLRAVVDYLREDGNVSFIGLWGRSMGAVTSLMYGAEDPSIAGMVLDSPFSDLVDLMMELVDTYKVRLPKFTVKFAIQYMRKAIQRKAKFDIMELNTIKVAKSCFVPVLFGHGIEDDFIQPHHSDRVFDAYVGDKNIIKFEGDHNSPRPQFYFDSISIFFNNVLQPPEDEGGNRYFDLTNDYFNRGSWSSTVQDVELSGELLESSSGPTATSTEDAIRQLRSRRPMSATVVPADISSNDNQPDYEVENRGSDAQPSTSNMISLEFARESPHGSLGPGSVDDEYVEYSLDMLADFPNNVEEEERMLMVAILESLKDSKTASPSTEELSSGVGGSSLPTPEPALKNEADGEIFLAEVPPTCPPSSIAEASRTRSPGDTSKCNGDTIYHSEDNTMTVKNPTSNVSVQRPCPVEGETSHLTPHNNNHNASSDADMADRTKVTVEVEKNPATNIIDGLLRRWDIFRNR